MTAILIFLKAYWKYIAVIAAVLAVWGALACWGHTKYTDGVADQKAKDKVIFDELARLTSATEEAVARRESQVAGMLESSNKAREEGIAHAVQEQQRIVADVRSGALRLRSQWACNSAANANTKTGATEPSIDGGAELRATGAAALIRAFDDADIQVRGLQDYARACQAVTQPLDVK